MGTCGLLCLAGPVSVGVCSGVLPGSTKQERTVGVVGRSPSSSRRVSLTSPRDLTRRASLLSQFSLEGSQGWGCGSLMPICAHTRLLPPLPQAHWEVTRGQSTWVTEESNIAHGPDNLRLWSQTDPSLNSGTSLHLSFLICKVGTVKPPTRWL